MQLVQLFLLVPFYSINQSGIPLLRIFSKRFFLGEVAGLTQNPQPGGPGFVSGLLPNEKLLTKILT
jgi:hypothetical protein